MNRIIFLDVDGVLNCSKTWSGPHADSLATLCPTMCDEFARIVKATGATVVLSSTWRLFDNEARTKLVRWLKERNITLHSFTPDLHKAAGWSGPVSRCKRGNEIAIWLEDHREEFPDPHFVIIDDDADMLPAQQPFFVNTTFEDGLTAWHADQAVQILCDDHLTLGGKKV